ncbi:hypothetical protein BDV96DRAFT_646614 [Lophiotrema nucula]|uniref:Uncharacterized protein n=1 Tax=Lophiotrema nucula TaxID=690887 RepID=A0A6A5Z6F9_9PLEO|nr:hypothetical protein BDV96DRAFT_646614 [Lophiotrema nucula]
MPAPSHKGLSTGAKAGIGAGVGEAAVAALVASFLLRRRRAKKNEVGSQHRAAPLQEAEVVHKGFYEYDPKSLLDFAGNARPDYLDVLVEAPIRSPPMEIPDSNDDRFR